MIFVIFASSLLIVAFGYILTEKNARYYLSGYNTMPEEECKAFNLASFIPAFRKFNLILGVSLFVIGSIISLLIGNSTAGVFLAVYPILAYIWFLWIGKKYSKGKTLKRNKIGIAILIVMPIFIIILMSTGFRENKIVVSSAGIIISGMYGEKIVASKIETVCLTDGLPSISLRTNGFAMENVRKGYFKTKTGEKVKLILNSEQPPFLLIAKRTGEKIYYSAGEELNQIIYDEIIGKLPGIKCAEQVKIN